MEQRYFVACHNDVVVWKRSSSGGAFTAITDEWFNIHKDNAVVYGCILTEEMEAKHIRAANVDERNKMCGSKYIGSNLSGVFREVAKDLIENRYVCFSGTPCQIGGLKSYLGVRNLKCENLITVEVICHGVGSTAFFRDYISHLEKKYYANAVQCRFRAKNHPEKKQDMEIVFENGKSYKASSTNYDWFYSVYLRDLILRPSCYKCRYAKKERIADISIADYWVSGIDVDKAKSLIIANSDAGLSLINNSIEDMVVSEISYDEVNQPHMKAPCKMPENYKMFWDTYLEKGYLASQKIVGNNSFSGYAKSAIVCVINKMRLKKLFMKLKRITKH